MVATRTASNLGDQNNARCRYRATAARDKGTAQDLARRHLRCRHACSARRRNLRHPIPQMTKPNRGAG